MSRLCLGNAASSGLAALVLVVACGSADHAGGPGSDGGSDDSCESADLSSDPEHCGMCGRDCSGGACAAGMCEPAVLAELDAPVQWLVPTSHGLVVVRDVMDFIPILLFPPGESVGVVLEPEWRASPHKRPVVVGDTVHVLHEACSASRVPLDPSEAAVRLTLPGDECYELAGNSTHAFIADGDQAYLWRLDYQGDFQPPIFVGEDFDQIYAVTADDDYVYFGGYGIRRVPASGGPVTSLVNADDIAWVSGMIGVADDYLYYHVYVPRETPEGAMGDYQIRRSPKLGQDADVEMTGVVSIRTGEEGMAVHAFREGAIYLSIQEYEPGQTRVLRLDANSGERSEIVSGSLSDFAVDDAVYYWAESIEDERSRIWIQVR